MSWSSLLLASGCAGADGTGGDKTTPSTNAEAEQTTDTEADSAGISDTATISNTESCDAASTAPESDMTGLWTGAFAYGDGLVSFELDDSLGYVAGSFDLDGTLGEVRCAEWDGDAFVAVGTYDSGSVVAQLTYRGVPSGDQWPGTLWFVLDGGATTSSLEFVLQRQ